VARRLGHRACTWSAARPGRHPLNQPRSAGRSRGAGAPPRARAQRGRRSRPGRSPGRGELFARVGGSSVSLTCSCADQGGRHVDMVVGADHRGRCCVAVWRGAGPSSPLTARRHQPDHGWRSCWTRPTAWQRGAVRPGPAGAADPQRCPARRARLHSRGWGHPHSATPSSSLLEMPRRSTSRSNAEVGVGLADGGGHRQPQPVAYRSDQPRLGLSSCEGSCSRPCRRPGPHRCHAASAASGPPPNNMRCRGHRRLPHLPWRDGGHKIGQEPAHVGEQMVDQIKQDAGRQASGRRMHLLRTVGRPERAARRRCGE
jgi:hypothetical protein